MLHSIIVKQGKYLDVRDDISKKYITFDIFHMFSYKSLAPGALILGILVIANNKPMNLCYRCYNLFITYFIMPIILKYIDIQIENNSSHLKETI